METIVKYKYVESDTNHTIEVLNLEDIPNNTTYEIIEESHIANIKNFKDLKICSFIKSHINSFEEVSQINFDILGFYKKYNLVKGELESVEYYESYDKNTDTYFNLILKINNTYNRDALYIVQNRVTIIDYYDNNNQLLFNKTWIKYYPVNQAIEEGVNRRNNMISACKTVLLKELKLVYGEPINQQYAFDLLLSVKVQLDYFKEGYTQPLKDAINSSTKSYLTETIKTLMVNELTV